MDKQLAHVFKCVISILFLTSWVHVISLDLISVKTYRNQSVGATYILVERIYANGKSNGHPCPL